MKKWDKIWNVTFDSFEEATIDKIEFKELNFESEMLNLESIKSKLKKD